MVLSLVPLAYSMQRPPIRPCRPEFPGPNGHSRQSSDGLCWRQPTTLIQDDGSGPCAETPHPTLIWGLSGPAVTPSPDPWALPLPAARTPIKQPQPWPVQETVSSRAHTSSFSDQRIKLLFASCSIGLINTRQKDPRCGTNSGGLVTLSKKAWFYKIMKSESKGDCPTSYKWTCDVTLLSLRIRYFLLNYDIWTGGGLKSTNFV